MTIYQRGKPVRDWLLSIDDAAKAIHVSPATIRSLVDDGYIKPAARKGFFRMGSIIDGHGQAICDGRLRAPIDRAIAPASFSR